MNEIEYQKATWKKCNVNGRDEHTCAARRVNLIIQSVLKQEDLILKQLESIEEEESQRQRVIVPIQDYYDCSTNMQVLLKAYKEVGNTLTVRSECLLTLVPVGRAHFTVLVAELETLDHTDCFIHVASHTVIINIHVAEDALRINQEQTAEGLSIIKTALILIIYAIRLHHLSGHVGKKRNVNIASKTTLFTGCSQPSKMSVRRVSRNADDLGIHCIQLFLSIIVGKDFRRTDKGPIHGIKEKNQPLALVLVEGNIGDRIETFSTVKAEIGSRLTNSRNHIERENDRDKIRMRIVKKAKIR